MERFLSTEEDISLVKEGQTAHVAVTRGAEAPSAKLADGEPPVRSGKDGPDADQKMGSRRVAYYGRYASGTLTFIEV